MAAVDQIWSEAVRTLEGDRPFALATVINVRGSTPREVGAKMIIRGPFGDAGTSTRVARSSPPVSIV